MIEIGKIIKTNGEFATVRIQRHSACGQCGKCGMGKNALHTDFSALNTCNATVGDTVKIEIKEVNTLKMSFFAYLLPLVFGLILFFVGYFVKFPDWACALMFLAGFAAAFLLACIVDRRKNHKWNDNPTILSIIQEGENNNNEQSERTD